MHTTTFSEMFPLPEGGYIIDTPGVKGFGTIDFEPEEVAHFFPKYLKFPMIAVLTTAHIAMNRLRRTCGSRTT